MLNLLLATCKFARQLRNDLIWQHCCVLMWMLGAKHWSSWTRE